MKVAFLTEMGFNSKIPSTHTNMRTEFAWMCLLDAKHYNLYKYQAVKGYDIVFIIFPKGMVYLSANGTKIKDGINPATALLELPLVETLKDNNNKVYYIQEGANWWWNDYSVIDQFRFLNLLSDTDGIFAHNEFDSLYYKGMFPNKKVETIRTLMIDSLIKNIIPAPEEKVLIGGNFAHWYGGFESYIIASNFELPIWVPSSHAKRKNEEYVENLNHFKWLDWLDWMRIVSTFKYAVHLMPTIAAGTFSLNCAYFGIPTIGNIKVDTQRILHPELSVDVGDVNSARRLAIELKNDIEFYKHCSDVCKENYNKFYKTDSWLADMLNKL